MDSFGLRLISRHCDIHCLVLRTAREYSTNVPRRIDLSRPVPLRAMLGVAVRWTQNIIDRVLTYRIRRAYRGGAVPKFPRAGFAGLIEEMQWGLAHLSEQQRREADARVFAALFGGRCGAALLRSAWRAKPGVVEGWMARLSPTALHFLVGDFQFVHPRTNVVPHCAFRELGGEDLCLRVCKQPTEQFTATNLVPLRFTPDPQSMACTWHWGEVTVEAP